MAERLEGRCRNLASDKEQLESAMDDLRKQLRKEKAELEAKNADLSSKSHMIDTTMRKKKNDFCTCMKK